MYDGIQRRNVAEQAKVIDFAHVAVAVIIVTTYVDRIAENVIENISL